MIGGHLLAAGRPGFEVQAAELVGGEAELGGHVFVAEQQLAVVGCARIAAQCDLVVGHAATDWGGCGVEVAQRNRSPAAAVNVPLRLLLRMSMTSAGLLDAAAEAPFEADVPAPLDEPDAPAVNGGLYPAAN